MFYVIKKVGRLAVAAVMAYALILSPGCGGSDDDFSGEDIDELIDAYESGYYDDYEYDFDE